MRCYQGLALAKRARQWNNISAMSNGVYLTTGFDDKCYSAFKISIVDCSVCDLLYELLGEIVKL